jgi:hypothetical protein
VTVSDGEGGGRKIWLSIYKAAPSVKGRFWRRVLQGDEDVNPELNKAPVYGINPNDPKSVKSAIDSVTIFYFYAEIIFF